MKKCQWTSVTSIDTGCAEDRKKGNSQNYSVAYEQNDGGSNNVKFLKIRRHKEQKRMPYSEIKLSLYFFVSIVERLDFRKLRK